MKATNFLILLEQARTDKSSLGQFEFSPYECVVALRCARAFEKEIERKKWRPSEKAMALVPIRRLKDKFERAIGEWNFQ